MNWTSHLISWMNPPVCILVSLQQTTPAQKSPRVCSQQHNEDQGRPITYQRPRTTVQDGAVKICPNHKAPLNPSEQIKEVGSTINCRLTARRSWFDSGPGSVCAGFAFSPCVLVGSLPVLWLPPTIQRPEVSHSNRSIGVNVSVSLCQRWTSNWSRIDPPFIQGQLGQVPVPPWPCSGTKQ